MFGATGSAGNAVYGGRDCRCHADDEADDDADDHANTSKGQADDRAGAGQCERLDHVHDRQRAEIAC